MKPWHYLLGAWLIAMAATLGAVFIGEVMRLPACNLCWYQRVCMFPLPVILGIASYLDDPRGALYAWPLAALGSAVAAYHSALMAGWVTERLVPCDAAASCLDQNLSIAGGLPIPWLAVTAFASITLLLTIYLRKTGS